MADQISKESLQEKKERQWRGALPNEKVQALLERIAELEIAHQLELMRALMPDVLDKLSPEERARFIQELEPTGEVQ